MPLVKNPHAPGYLFVKTQEEKSVLEEELMAERARLEKINLDVNKDGVVNEKDISDLADAMVLNKNKGVRK